MKTMTEMWILLLFNFDPQSFSISFILLDVFQFWEELSIQYSVDFMYLKTNPIIF